MRSLLFVFLASAVGACSPSTPASDPAPATANDDAALKSTLRAYVVEFLRRNPTTNTYLGGAGLDPSLAEVDGALRDHSAAALAEEDRWLGDVSNRLAEIPTASLPDASRIDREVALAQIRFMLRQHQVRRYPERALDTYASEPFRALDWQLQGMTETGAGTYGTAAEWALAVRRVASIPQFLATAQAQLEAGVMSDRVPDRRMLLRDGLNTSEANAKYFGEALPKMAGERMSGSDKARLLEELRGACQKASEAYLRFRQFIASTFFDDAAAGKVKQRFAADRFVMGADEYNWALKNNFRVTDSAETLFDQAWPVVEKTRQQMIDLARELARQRNWKLPGDGPAAVRAVFDELSKDYPKSDEEMLAWYRDAAFRLVDYGRRTGIFDVPADYKLDVVETPPPLQASIDGAAYYPAPPFKTTGVGRFYVTTTNNDRAALQSNNRASLADLAAHEGFPGHDWYYKVLTSVREGVSGVRWLTPGAVEDSSSMWEDSMSAEGWGLYAETLMAEPQPTAPRGFYTLDERLYQLQGQLYRDLRVRIDTGLHTGRMTYAQAVDLFSDLVDFLPGSCADSSSEKAVRSPAKQASCNASERAIFRYSKWPTQAITYRLGKDQIFALRSETMKQLGEKFSPKTFHLRFIRQGTIPAGYFREALLKELSTDR
jgi:uncharacterized protein (DUF885 family)